MSQSQDFTAAEHENAVPNNTVPDAGTEQSTSAGNAEASAPVPDEVEKLKSQAQEYMAGWQRERAEFANYKRRVERDLKDSYGSASADVLTSFLPIIDDFERALVNAPADLQGTPWFGGTTAIQRKMHKVLEEFGVSIVDPIGQPFDPNKHQAVAADEDTGSESGTITETLQKGYVVGERVLRPAFVRVAK